MSVYIWIVLKNTFQLCPAFFSKSCKQCTELTSTFFYKNNVKIGFHDTIHTFKNYVATVFSIFSFQQ